VTTETKVEAVAWRVLEIGNRGAAYDPRDAKRAFTYDHQPGNIDASKLGRATVVASLASAGDSIDRGLSLLKALQAEGFGVFQVGQEAQSAITALEGEVEIAAKAYFEDMCSLDRWNDPMDEKEREDWCDGARKIITAALGAWVVPVGRKQPHKEYLMHTRGHDDYAAGLFGDAGVKIAEKFTEQVYALRQEKPE
jgi:hypothetical protein